MISTFLTSKTSSKASTGALSAAACVALGLLASAPAAAQSEDAPAAKPVFTLGMGVVHAPEYEGSDEGKTRALPMLNYRNGRFFAGVLGGVGYNFSNSPQVQFGPVMSYRLGRDASDSERLRGMGDIDGGADVGGFVRWNLRPFSLHATVKQGVSGDVKGTQVRVGAGYGMVLGPSDRLMFDASLDWADSELMQTYYGVNAVQSANSGLSAYSASSGVRRYGVGAIWSHSFTQQWFSSVSVGVYRLGADAADSPITVKRNVGLVSAGLGYRF